MLLLDKFNAIKVNKSVIMDRNNNHLLILIVRVGILCVLYREIMNNS
jgi:hypothetical protein